MCWRKTLTTFSGSLWLGKYFTFSWVSLIISVNFFPSISSSKTHIETWVSNCSLCLTTLCPMILAMAEPLYKQKNCRNSLENTARHFSQDASSNLHIEEGKQCRKVGWGSPSGIGFLKFDLFLHQQADLTKPIPAEMEQLDKLICFI